MIEQQMPAQLPGWALALVIGTVVTGGPPGSEGGLVSNFDSGDMTVAFEQEPS